MMLLLAIISGLSACTTDDEVDTAGANYVMSLRTQNANDESADYYITVDDLLNGEISAVGQGVELIGWNYNAKFGDTYFAFGYDLNECIGYKLQDGELISQGKFVFERIDVMEPLDNDYFLGIGAPWGGGSYDCNLQVVSIDDIAIDHNAEHPIYESFHYVDSLDQSVQLNAWPTGAYLDNDKLFVSFYPLHGTSWQTPNTDTAYVSVFSYPELDYIKTIKDDRTGPIGYYGGSPVILENEGGDHFFVSTGCKACGFTQVTKSSGILKVNAGETEFDPNYYFDVEGKTGYKVLSGTYVGNGLAVARVISTQLDDQASAVNMWATFSEVTPILNAAVIDLNAETLTIVEDVPLHGGQYKTPYLVENGKVYISVNTGTDAHVYEVDPASATATKGAKLIGNQFQALFATK
ncbi:DUF4374 domain-containing protein [Marinoscillum pacificum]|uniref:DUF4374 domain-containing protein n=1 Tax=Marinoscillum pacificum TaxID=392723 RepID=UPI0021588D70|nr:DUF4374 domain-containing protein [Marinoscillum pacificum]